MTTPGKKILKQAIVKGDIVNLIDALRYEDTRKEASDALANIGEKTVISLFELLMSESSMDEDKIENAATYESVYTTLRKIGEPALTFLINVLEGYSPYQNVESISSSRSTAAKALAYMDDLRAVAPLIRRIEDKNEDAIVQHEASWALEDLRAQDRKSQHLRHIFEEGGNEIRLSICKILSMFGNKEALPALRWLERIEADKDVKEAIIDAITDIRKRWDEDI